MAWNNPNELLVGGTGQIYVAPVGTAEPASYNTALNAAFTGLGLTDEDGVSVTVDPEIQEYKAWQSRVPVRRALTGQQVTIAFKLEQWNENTVPFAFGGGVVTALGGGAYKYTLPDGQAALDERIMIADVVDGSTIWRFVFPRGNVSESVGVDFKRTELGMLPISFRATAPSTNPEGPPGYFYTNSAGFAVGS